MHTTGAQRSAVIEVRGLVKVFRDFWRRPRVRAVDGLDLEVAEGEIFGLLGPNGSGKSSTLRILLGLLHPTSGEVRIFGRPPHDVEVKNKIGYLPEESYLYPQLSAWETLDFFGCLFGLDRRTRRERTGELLEMVGLTHAAQRPVGEFSKGMARRVGLAQALINDPALLVLDEPTAGLDPIGCRQIKDLLLTLARRGKTIVLSSHLLADVEDVCDSLTILFNGRPCASGRTRTLLEVQDRMRITVPEQDPNKLRELLTLLRAHCGSEPFVDRPSRNLEQFFIEVVEQAHRDTAAESSVRPPGGLPKYLGRNG
ncbi:MAG: ABC transporter ATP-binding protein [Kiritimatiellia bacterium]